MAYSNSNAYSSEDAHPVLFYYFDTIGTITYREYQWKVGDRLDVLAYQMYRNSGLWWIIAEHNPEIHDPNNIPVGSVLRIPNV